MVILNGWRWWRNASRKIRPILIFFPELIIAANSHHKPTFGNLSSTSGHAPNIHGMQPPLSSAKSQMFRSSLHTHDNEHQALWKQNQRWAFSKAPNSSRRYASVPDHSLDRPALHRLGTRLMTYHFWAIGKQTLNFSIYLSGFFSQWPKIGVSQP